VGKALGKGLGELRKSLNSEPAQEEPIAILAKQQDKKVGQEAAERRKD
jgi:Sec-independent protein translocase protein TatA